MPPQAGNLFIFNSEKLRILLVPSSYLPVLGGLQEAVSQLTCEFKARGHEVMVITNRYPRNLKRQENIDGIEVVRMLFPGLYLATLSLRRIEQFIAGLLIAPVNYLRLLMLLRKQRPDVVNIHFLGSQASYAMLASKTLGVRCVVSLHGDDVEGLPRRSKIDFWLFNKVLTAADHVTACSRYLLSEAEKLVPEIGAKSTVIHNGIRPEEFRNILPFTNTGPYIFAAGRLVYKKGFDVLLRAYRIALDKGLKVDLILAGEGHREKKLISLAMDLGLPLVQRGKNSASSDGKNGTASKVIFWGRAERAEMKSLMKGCDLFVIPSRQESFGIVALEAFAAGKKVVACRTGGLPEIVREGDGSRLVAPEDVEELAEGICSALQDKNEKIIPDLKGNSWDAVSTRYLGVYAGTDILA